MWNTIKSISSLLLSYGMLLLGNGMISILLGLRSRLAYPVITHTHYM